MNILNNKISEVPYRVEKQKLKDYVQFDNCLTTSKLIHQIAMYSNCIFKMKSTMQNL
ncbi:hypothetical protein HZS_7527 [Henneguya salminicola]|nr:hypothetical protein HZS_7527 [Henneguya salminicola]